MLVVIAILQLIMIGILLNINGKLKPRDYIAEAMERDRQIREERERKRQMEPWSHEAGASSADHS
ncbi:hypothetical protein AK95_26825 [Paenibacillus sp. LC231]|uniref:hypothetical protein n=1 Tax=Paenibacillus TaxID=44249 RepID=UPI0008DE0CC5|nr:MULTISPECIES: hypothetical protein [Paenibacillus]MBU5347618.1 hypothetical protein [Paenibacillus lautus]OIB00772.1 hypothetical protein AK95_26825 [Paenibacillus sp. LC231]